MPNPWLFHSAPLQRWDFDAEAWVTAPASVTVPSGSLQRFRATWYVTNGDDTLTTGELWLQRRRRSGSWEDVYSIKLVDPQTVAGVGIPAPVWRQFSDYGDNDFGDVDYRVDVRAAGDMGGKSSIFDVTLQAVDALVGELDDFLAGAGDYATVRPTTGPSKLLASIFEAPFSAALEVDGVRPVLIAETAVLEQIGTKLGSDVQVAGTDYKVRQINPSADDTAEVVLEVV